MKNPIIPARFFCQWHPDDSKLIPSIFVLTVLLLAPEFLFAQLGIGTKTPRERLHVFEGSVYAESKQLDPVNNSFPPQDSVYYKFQWFHRKGALRSMTERTGKGGFELVNIGPLSFATGYESFATGTGAFAAGREVFSSGNFSAGFGELVTVGGDYAFGQGYNVIASGLHSVALGTRVSTNSQTGSFILGDDGGGTSQNDAKNQMMMRFSGGYKLFTSSLNVLGVQLGAGGNAWSVISDVRKKENFAPVNGEDFLQKISQINLTSWNYKGQDPKIFRHYGPIAQDFFKAFGQDSYGTIGSDTTINQADFDGVNLIAIQALVKRTEQLQQMNDRLLGEIMTLKEELRTTSRAVKRRKAWVARK
ncbi:tail fiber domain-containing protein [Dyadobacter fermentans]|uniref:Peptidase S74 domain-containing protein n=1 Tax=Dyadobacter fermentans (strain ATCC 700827 / DSM 18053 / CIP 107007 / KCTC 52180 / NS114) TaxID=471854 RepID=C6W322_DYAFD|nr:tail fiber domain-containing protein [Dyadobacter fermentans]ACT95735.1 hypothetical protein Dfer_4534 [Dyadobacter fermentans DSM 18053]